MRYPRTRTQHGGHVPDLCSVMVTAVTLISMEIFLLKANSLFLCACTPGTHTLCSCTIIHEGGRAPQVQFVPCPVQRYQVAGSGKDPYLLKTLESHHCSKQTILCYNNWVSIKQFYIFIGFSERKSIPHVYMHASKHTYTLSYSNNGFTSSSCKTLGRGIQHAGSTLWGKITLIFFTNHVTVQS